MKKRLVIMVGGLFVLAGLLGPLALCAQPPEETREERIELLNLPSVPLQIFLKVITERSDMKLVTTGELAKREVSVYLADVTPREALEAVLAAQGLYLEAQEGSSVLLIKENDSAFFPLEHVAAEDLQGVVPTLMGEEGRVGLDPTTNVIAVEGSRSAIEKVRKMVSQVDKTPGQVLIEAVLVEINEDAGSQLGIRWEPSAFFRGAVRQTRLPFTGGYVKEEDDADAFVFGLVSFQDFFVQLQFMERDGTARIIATPRIAVIEGKEATIKITSNIVVATELTRETEQLDLITEEPVYSEVGVTLKTTPQVHPDGQITLKVEPSVSTAARARFFAEAVDTFHRSASTTVMVQDGETIAIGGLLRTDETIQTHKVPVLGDIPLLKYLFTHKDTVAAKTDLVVFLTPRILNAERIREEATEQKERIRLSELLEEAAIDHHRERGTPPEPPEEPAVEDEPQGPAEVPAIED